MKFKKLVSALTLGTVMSTIALGTVSCLDANAAEIADEQFWESYNIAELESAKDNILLETKDIRLLPGSTCEVPIIPEEGNVTYNYTSSDQELVVIVEKDGRAVIVAKDKEGVATITIRSSNNKVAYLNVTISNVIENVIEEEEIGSESYLSDTSLANSLPEKIVINDNETAKKITIVEGETITLTATLSPIVANGKWQIYWHYNYLDGDTPNYSPTPADYFAYKLVDSSQGGEVNDSGQIDTSEGLWANGVKMGYKVEVMGIKQGSGRKLVCESVGGIKREFSIDVIGKEKEETTANIMAIGNKGSSIEIEGLSTGYVTAVSYGSEGTTSDTFKAESLTPDVCEVDTSSSSFVAGGFASVTAKKIGEGWIKISSGSATALCKVTVSNLEVLAIGNLKFDITASKSHMHGKKPDDGSEYTNERFIADGIITHIVGNYFPSNATKLPAGEDIGFVTDYKSVGKGLATDMVEVNSGAVSFFTKNATVKSDAFEPRRRGDQTNDESSGRSLDGNYMIITKKSVIKDNKEGIRAARAAMQNKGAFGTEFGFVVSNNDAHTGDELSVEGQELGTNGISSSTSSSTDSTDDTYVPVFFVMDTGKNDVKSTSAVTSTEKADYTEIMGDYSIRKSSIISYSANYEQLPSTLKAGSSTTLPTNIDKVPKKETTSRPDNKIDVKTYTFKGWALRGSESTIVTSVTPASTDKVVIIMAKYDSKVETKDVFSE